MKERKTTTASAILISIIVIIIYTILALRPLSTELHFTPEWTADITHTGQANPEDIRLPFKLKQNMGYFTPEGKILLSQTFPFKATISENHYATYNSGNSSTTLFASDSTTECVIEEYGFPYLEEDRIYMMLPGGNSFAQFNKDGSLKWQYESYAPVTAFNSSEGGTVAGFADGLLVAFDSNGSITQRFIPGGSETNIILGADISKDGTKVACVNGQNKQRLVVAENNGEHSKIIFHEYMDTDLTRQTLVKFHNNAVYYNYNGGVGVVDLDKVKSYKIPIEGMVTQIEFSDDENLAFILSRNGSKWTITAIEPFNHFAGMFSYNAESSFIQIHENGLFIGKDNTISRISISRR